MVPEKNIFVDGEVHETNWRAFKVEYKFTSVSMAAVIREAGEDFLRSKLVKGWKNRALPEHTNRAFSNFIKEKKIVRFAERTFQPCHLRTFENPGLATSRCQNGDKKESR